MSERWKYAALALALVLLGVAVSTLPGLYDDWAFLRAARYAAQYGQRVAASPTPSPAPTPAPSPSPSPSPSPGK